MYHVRLFRLSVLQRASFHLLLNLSPHFPGLGYTEIALHMLLCTFIYQGKLELSQSDFITDSKNKIYSTLRNLASISHMFYIMLIHITWIFIFFWANQLHWVLKNEYCSVSSKHGVDFLLGIATCYRNKSS